VPEDIWKLVLEHVPLRQRLCECALVCRKFHAAVIAATKSIETRLSKQSSADNLVEYLSRHGSHLTSMNLSGSEIGAGKCTLLGQLPSCQHVQQLSIEYFDVQLCGDEGLPGVLNSITGLTRLELDDCLVNPKGTVGSVADLSVLVNLRHLRIGFDLWLSFSEGSLDPQPLSEVGWSTNAWSGLHHLTHLKLGWVVLAAEDVQHLSTLSSLSVLSVSGDVHLAVMAAPGLALSQSLRSLVITGMHGRSITCPVLGPSVLAALTRLTRLKLAGVRVKGEGEVGGGLCLLQAVSKLQRLRRLVFARLDVEWPPPSPAYQAVVASSKLRWLTWADCQLPPGVFAHIFPCPHSDQHGELVSFVIQECGALCSRCRTTSSAVVANLASCCPALQELQIAVDGWVCLTPLCQLSALASLLLKVDGGPDGTAASIHSLSGLTGLRSLHLKTQQLSTAAISRVLLPLTALRQLNTFSCQDSGEAQGVELDTYQRVSEWVDCLQHWHVLGFQANGLLLQPPRAVRLKHGRYTYGQQWRELLHRHTFMWHPFLS